MATVHLPPSYSSSPSSSSESSKTRSMEGSLGSRFQMISVKHKFRYNLPTDTTDYAMTRFESYVKKADLKQQILMENSVPDNLDQVTKIGRFCSRYVHDLDMDVTFEKIQSRNTCVTGPLSKL